MVNRKYSKCFPKKYRERTDWAKNSYSLYARPNNGLVFERNGTRFTNQYVVPYYSQLLLLFNCHLNVEISAGLGTVKYLRKYIYKGPDRATMEISGGMKSRLIWMVSLLVQQKLAGRSLNSICIESHQLSNVFLSIFPMNTMSTSMLTRLSMKCELGKMWRRLS